MTLWDNFRNVVNGVEDTSNKVFGAVGAVLGGAIERVPGGQQFFEAYDAANRNISKAASLGISALPGGTPTFTPEQAAQISPQQAALAQAAAWERQGPLGRTATQMLAGPGWGLYKAVAGATDPNNPLLSPDFDVTDPEQRKAAFVDNPLGKTASGLGDAAFSWYADAGVIGGKVVKVARSGTQVGGKTFMGLTDRTVRSADDAVRLSNEIDQHVLFRKSNGMMGRETAAGIAVERTVTKDAAQMLWDPLARRSTNKSLVASLLGDSTDLETSALIVKAGLGVKPAMDELRAKAASTADALDRAKSLDVTARDAFTRPIGDLGGAEWWVKRPELVERLDNIVADLEAKDAFLQRALDIENNAGAISKIGSRSVALEKGRSAYLAERANTKLDPNRWVTDAAFEGGPAFVERVYQRNPYVRPVRVVAKSLNWIEGQRPNGWIGIKGNLYNDSANEMWAALTNSPTLARNADNLMYRNEVMNEYLRATNPTERMNVVTRLEREASQRIAARYGIEPDVADSLYESYSRARQSGTRFLQERGYMVDADGSILKSPVLTSQLADSMPMMDFRVYEDLIRRHQSPLRKVAGGTKDFTLSYILEPFYTAWKASVLFRLGYTIRNVAEGNLRAAAAYGTLPVLADPVGAIKRFAKNDARREAMARNYAYELLTGRSPRRIQSQIDRMRALQDAAERQLADLETQADYIRLSEMPAATGVDTMLYDDYIKAAPEHGVRFDIGDLEGAIGSATDSLLPTRQRERFLQLNDFEQAGEVMTGSLINEYRHLRAKAARTRLRELKASGKEIVVFRNGKPTVVKNVRDLTDEDLVPVIDSRRGVPGRAIEDEVVDAEFGRVGPRPVPEVYVVDRWKANIQTANRMNETVPGRVAKQARVRNPIPIGRYDYYLDEVDKQIALSAIDNIRSIEETLSGLYTQLDEAAARRTKIGTRERLGDDDVFSGTYGAIARANSSADATYENVVQDMMSRYEIQQSNQMASWGPVNPTDKQYFPELAHIANYQFKNDMVALKVLEGQRRADIAKWLKSDEARQYRRDMGIDKIDAEAHVSQVHDMVTSYIPDTALRLRVAKETLGETDFRAALAPYDLVQIHGRQVQQVTAPIMQFNPFRAAVKWSYRLLGSAPEDLAVRHPFYRAMYGQEYDRLRQMMIDQGQIIDDALSTKLGRQAHSFALRETKRTLYTIDRYSNPAMVLRWIIPFFPAYENTMLTWLRLGLEDPSIIARANLLWNAPNEMGLVVDGEGNILPPGSTFDKEAYIRLPKPLADAIAKRVPGGQVPDIPKASANVVLPGQNPFSPGLGVPVTVPVNMWIAKDPTNEEMVKNALTRVLGKEGGEIVYKQFVPFGTASGDPADVTLSASLKQAQIKLGGEGNADFMMSALAIYRDRLQQWQLGGMQGPKPTPEDALAQADDYRDLRIVSSLLQPVALRWRSPFQIYINEYRRLTTELGFEQGEAVFDRKYPEYSVLKRSLSSNPTGMSASMPSYNMYKANKGLWNEVTKGDPKYGQMITNPVARGEFNPTVYEWMKGRPVRPGSSVQLKTVQSLEEFEKEDTISRGWSEYRKAKAIRDTMLAELGLTDIRQPGAEEIRAAWNAWMDKAEIENPEWYTEKEKFSNSATVRETITAVTRIAQDDNFLKMTPDKDLWLLVSDYLEKRDYMARYLTTSPDGKSLESNDNAAMAWGAYVEKLRASNTKFADFYDRWLESDDLQIVTVN